MEEVADMENITMTMTRPSMPLTVACAPSAAPLAPAAAVWLAPAELATAAPVAVLAAERAPVSRVHQVSVQAELAEQGRISKISTTTGFKGSNVSIKSYTYGGSGVPPRGRPV
jgi:hypothetical protein